MLKTITIAAADVAGLGIEPPNTRIEINSCIPAKLGKVSGGAALHQYAKFYDSQAEKLFQGLRESVPGGTLDALLRKLLVHRASLLIVPQSK
jgi:hypothetical protein